MSLIKYDEDSLKIFKNKSDIYISEILDSLKNIYRELNTIDVVLSTPKTNKVVPSVLEYYNKQIKYVNSFIDTFNKDYNTIINEYNSFFSDVQRMVGGNHGE